MKARRPAMTYDSATRERQHQFGCNQQLPSPPNFHPRSGLLATALLLGFASSLPCTGATASSATTSAATVTSPPRDLFSLAPVSLATLRRRRESGELGDVEERAPSVGARDSTVTLRLTRGANDVSYRNIRSRRSSLGSSGSRSNPWVTAQSIRGGAFGRRSRKTASANAGPPAVAVAARTPPVVHIPPESMEEGDYENEDDLEMDEEELQEATGVEILDDGSEDTSHDFEDGVANGGGDDSSNDDDDDDDESEESDVETDRQGGDGKGKGDDEDDSETEGDDGGATEAAEGATREQQRKQQPRPTAPLFSFPPGPRVERTKAEESLQDVLPMQQRLVKYLTEDKVFGAQILCSVYFLMSAVAYAVDSDKYGGCYQAGLMSLTIKQWGTVIGRVRRVLVPHLLYEPQRYQKFRARVSALALDPAVQGIVYCGIFMFMPLGNALLPLILKESVYLLWVIKEVLQIAAPGLVGTLANILEPAMSVVMTAGDVRKWRGTSDSERRLLLGRRLAQISLKLELAMPFNIAIRVLPSVLQASVVGGGAAEGGGNAAVDAKTNGGGVPEMIARALPGLKFMMLMLTYVKLLALKNKQLDDDVRVLRGLKIRGYRCDWVEQMLDSVVFGKMVGCPWWVGILASVFTLLPNHESTKAVMASDTKVKTLAMALLNLSIGRKPGAIDDEEDEEDKEGSGTGDEEDAAPPSKLSRMAKVAAVATGITDS